MRLFLATTNEHKILEMKELLSDTDIELLSAADIREELPEVIEDKDTFRGNALKKARTIADYLDLAVIADDSGLAVDALEGRPGVYSARYAGIDATDKENNQKLLEELSGVEARTARFVCAIAFVTGEEEKIVTGKCEGKIAFKAQGENGFGYDPLFIPKGYQKSFGQLGSEIKNKISHRALALEKLKEILIAKLNN